jgi:abhydrolase domain-containing protein 17
VRELPPFIDRVANPTTSRSSVVSSLVPASLAFYPPTPSSYTLAPVSKADETTTAYMRSLGVSSTQIWSLRGTAAEYVIPYSNIFITEVSSRLRRRIPVFTILYPGAVFTILFSHGNAADAGLMRNTLVVLAVNLRCNVVFYDYTGYGPGAGGPVRPSEADACADADAVYDFCVASPALCRGSPDLLVVHGQSIGSGPTVYLASRRRCRAVVLESAIASGLRVLMWNRPLLLRCFDIFPNLDRMPQVCHVMIGLGGYCCYNKFKWPASNL